MKLLNWQADLANTIEKFRHARFKWGTCDCVLFANECLQVQTGISLRDKYPKEYATEKEASRYIKEICGGGVVELAEKMASECAWPEVPVGFSHKGDFIVFNSEEVGPTLGIVTLDPQRFAATTMEGLYLFPKSMIMRAWRVG